MSWPTQLHMQGLGRINKLTKLMWDSEWWMDDMQLTDCSFHLVKVLVKFIFLCPPPLFFFFFFFTHSHTNFHCSDAYKVACLGVTDGDWECLAHAALEDLNFPVARQAFIRIKDLKYLELINEFQVWNLLFRCICVYLPVQVCDFYSKSCNIRHWMIWKDLVNQTLTERRITFHCSIKQWHLAPILRV